jgi:ABC-type oligopeptide transport system substrate-binding subunit
MGCQPKAEETPISPTTPAPTATKPATKVPPTAAPIKPTTAPTEAAPQLSLINPDLQLDPAITQDADSLMVSKYLYEGLVRLDASGKPTPGLAESWVISDDQLDYIFTLRAGITFSDGTPITPDIVADNFNRWFDPQSPLRGTGTYDTWQAIFLGFHGEKDDQNQPKSPVDGIQKVDQFTVLIHLNRPVPELLTNLANPAFAILKTDALANGAYGGRDSQFVSSGQYIVKAWTDKGLQLSPNPKYWGEAAKNDLEFGWNK